MYFYSENEMFDFVTKRFFLFSSKIFILFEDFKHSKWF
ncbi:hypothetical protein LEP1GSC158_5231 [Leptospira interrogans serovar Zanoni str. LT2156]|uniref:Uncharacterized protein n=1 Tax=Leptospira interrogans serovar Zanoni str. LT2156 TaxID=1001601 RepID=M6H791_LEPIR|nr:hypothetical protein LEP1GSC158_5231 [Leptospira interrogans serovar Zanoni str. LT2156]